MIRKDLFVNCLEKYRAYRDWEEQISSLGIDIEENEIINSMVTAFTNLLAYCCNDEYNEGDIYPNTIDYFVYDLDFGRYKPKIEDLNNLLYLKNIDELWELLINCSPEIEDPREKPELQQSSYEFSPEELEKLEKELDIK